MLSLPKVSSFSNFYPLSKNLSSNLCKMASTYIHAKDPSFKKRCGSLMEHSKESPDLESSEYKFGKYPIDKREVFFFSKHCIGFVNYKPFVDGHVLVSTRRIVKYMSELEEEEINDVFLSCQKVSDIIKSRHDATAMTLSIQDGEDAGQTVPHFHVHIVPRKKKDIENNDEIYPRLEKANLHLKEEPYTRLDNEERKPRTVEEMEAEANDLKKWMVHLYDTYKS